MAERLSEYASGSCAASNKCQYGEDVGTHFALYTAVQTTELMIK